MTIGVFERNCKIVDPDDEHLAENKCLGNEDLASLTSKVKKFYGSFANMSNKNNSEKVEVNAEMAMCSCDTNVCNNQTKPSHGNGALESTHKNTKTDAVLGPPPVAGHDTQPDTVLSSASTPLPANDMQPVTASTPPIGDDMQSDNVLNPPSTPLPDTHPDNVLTPANTPVSVHDTQPDTVLKPVTKASSDYDSVLKPVSTQHSDHDVQPDTVLTPVTMQHSGHGEQPDDVQKDPDRTHVIDYEYEDDSGMYDYDTSDLFQMGPQEDYDTSTFKTTSVTNVHVTFSLHESKAPNAKDESTANSSQMATLLLSEKSAIILVCVIYTLF